MHKKLIQLKPMRVHAKNKESESHIDKERNIKHLFIRKEICKL